MFICFVVDKLIACVPTYHRVNIDFLNYLSGKLQDFENLFGWLFKSFLYYNLLDTFQDKKKENPMKFSQKRFFQSKTDRGNILKKIIFFHFLLLKLFQNNERFL